MSAACDELTVRGFMYTAVGKLRRGLGVPAALGAVLLLAAAICGEASACPTCKKGLEENPQMIAAYAAAIAIMLGTPFLLLSGWIVAIWRLSRSVGSEVPTRQ